MQKQPPPVVQADQQEGCVFCLEADGTLGDESLVVHRGDAVVVLLILFGGRLAPIELLPESGALESLWARV